MFLPLVFLVYLDLIIIYLSWCPCMAINIISVQYNGGFLPDIVLLTLLYNDLKSFYPYSLCSSLNVLTIFSPDCWVDAQKI